MARRIMAKEAAIKNVVRQRKVISARLDATRRDGDPTYRYIGTLFPANREFFESEGFIILTFKSQNYKFEGLDVNVFTPSEENLTLTEEEIAEAMENEDQAPEDYEDYALRSIAKLFGVDDDDDDSDECDEDDD